MAVAALLGLGTGAVHAVTGPDHVLSLAPMSARSGARAWRLGLRWGAGHAVGTVLVALVALLLVGAHGSGFLSVWGDRLAGAALMATGVLGLRGWWAARAGGAPAAASSCAAPVAMGLVHGVAGGAAVLGLIAGSVPWTPGHVLVYVLAFGLGSTAAMALACRAVGRLGALVRHPRALARLAVAASAIAAVVGAAWLLASL